MFRSAQHDIAQKINLKGGITMIYTTKEIHRDIPKDVFESPFAKLHYYITEEENNQYSSISLTTDETSSFSDIQSLKEHFKKEARRYAVSINHVKHDEYTLNADFGSLNVMGNMIIATLAKALCESEDKNIQKVLDDVFIFKDADNKLQKITLRELVKLHNEGIKDYSNLWLKHDKEKENIEETKEDVKEAETKDVETQETPTIETENKDDKD